MVRACGDAATRLPWADPPIAPCAALTLVLAATSVTQAVARGQEAGITQMVICAGGTTMTVSLDAQGNPVSHPHHCPDCLQAAGVGAMPPRPAILPQLARPAFVASHATHVAPRTHPFARAPRGPPVLS